MTKEFYMKIHEIAQGLAEEAAGLGEAYVDDYVYGSLIERFDINIADAYYEFDLNFSCGSHC